MFTHELEDDHPRGNVLSMTSTTNTNTIPARKGTVGVVAPDGTALYRRTDVGYTHATVGQHRGKAAILSMHTTVQRALVAASKNGGTVVPVAEQVKVSPVTTAKLTEAIEVSNVIKLPTAKAVKAAADKSARTGKPAAVKAATVGRTTEADADVAKWIRAQLTKRPEVGARVLLSEFRATGRKCSQERFTAMVAKAKA